MLIHRCALACILFSAFANAQDWPSQRPITLVTPGSPGALIDTLARLMAARAGPAIGQSIITEYRPGAAGNIAAQRVRKAQADGYTILISPATYAINPSLYANAGYDPISDFSPILLVGTTPSLISVHPSVAATNLQELILLSKQQSLFYASPPSGTTAHLAMERIKTLTKSSITHVPGSTQQSITATLVGQTQILILGAALHVPHINSKKLRPIAVTSTERWSVFPEIKTAIEQGIPGIDYVAWFGCFAPTGTPNAIVMRLNQAMTEALEHPEVRERIRDLGVEFRKNAPSEFANFIKDEVPKWAQAVKESGARVD